MEHKEHRYSLFEEELRKNIDDSKVDYSAVESTLFSRISDAEQFRELAILKLDEIPSAESLDLVEQRLFSQIIQYNEYEVPINECISTEYDLSASQWDRLNAKIEEKIRSSTAIPEWEQVIMASEKEPLQGEWEKIEEKLFERIGEISKREDWEQCTLLEEVQIQESLDSVEKKLDQQIMSNQDLPDWEYVIKAEKIIPYNKWESIEERLFSRIENGELKIDKQPFWHIIDYYVILTKVARVASVAMLAVLIVVGSFMIQDKMTAKIPTLVYQLQGNATKNVELIKNSVQEQCSSVVGGAVSIINSHGLIELQNGSEIKINRLTKEHAWYKVGFNPSSNGEVARGKVAFLVNPHRGKESFRVQTPDYQIVVKGTYFKVEPDLGGRVSTRVLEGEVKVVSGLFKDTVIKAGQSLVYDVLTNEYKIQSGGTVVQRKEIESVPDVNDLIKYKVITISSTVPESEIRIDGKYYGMVPLTIRQSPGVHQIRVGKEGFITFDTLVSLTGEDLSYTIDVSLKPKPSSEFVAVKKENRTTEKVQAREKVISPESVAHQLLGSEKNVENKENSSADSIYELAQKAESKGNWKEAVKLYQEVFNEPNASRLRKEDALFSIGKLKADHDNYRSEAQQVFFTYLALYPGGMFAGETWLRLAELEFKENPENAVQYYLKYFEMFPRHARISELQNRVGVIYLQQKRFDEAISMFRQALSNLVSPAKGERENITSNLHRALEAKSEAKAQDVKSRQYIQNTENDVFR